ncbi:MAG: TIGR01777 family protein [Arcobacter sp.]|nr:MAG: TIGR01777 family protein [Arcobacter sp.]
MKTLAITGLGGFVGQELKKRFESKGYEVIRIKRGELKDIQKLTSIMEKADYLVNLAGATIINRWTNAYKRILYSSRIDTTKVLVEAMKKAKLKPKIFISTSAVGIYKNKACYDEENYEYGDDFLATLCKKWEEEALKAENLGIRTVIFRFGIVLGKGGALRKMLTPFKLGIGGIIADGKQHTSFIHIEDLLNAYEFVIENKNCEGVFNLTAPVATTNYGLTKALGNALHRPTIFPIPKFVLNLILGEGSRVLTDGQCAKPKRLLEKGFNFKFENIEDALFDLVKI